METRWDLMNGNVTAKSNWCLIRIIMRWQWNSVNALFVIRCVEWNAIFFCAHFFGLFIHIMDFCLELVEIITIFTFFFFSKILIWMSLCHVLIFCMSHIFFPAMSYICVSCFYRTRCNKHLQQLPPHHQQQTTIGSSNVKMEQQFFNSHKIFTLKWEEKKKLHENIFESNWKCFSIFFYSWK